MVIAVGTTCAPSDFAWVVQVSEGDTPLREVPTMRTIVPLGRIYVTIYVASLFVTFELVSPSALAWDSDAGNPTHATHSYLTEWSLDQIKADYPELEKNRKAVIEGANTELHE